MELWIRSQDKEKLVKVNDIAIESDSEEGKTIRGYNIVGNYEILGFYTLHSRALEILDEIQEIMTNLADSNLKIIQYEMPKD